MENFNEAIVLVDAIVNFERPADNQPARSLVDADEKEGRFPETFEESRRGQQYGCRHIRQRLCLLKR
jgi:hypothetical protein